MLNMYVPGTKVLLDVPVLVPRVVGIVLPLPPHSTLPAPPDHFLPLFICINPIDCEEEKEI